MSRLLLLLLLLTSLCFSQDTPTPPQWLVPNFHDLKIKLRDTTYAPVPHIRTWYFHGARQRDEYLPEGNTSVAPQAFIGQCDQKAVFHIDEGTKTYFPSHLVAVYHELNGRGASGIRNSDAEVTVTTNSVDTGDRRAIGYYQARHIKTTITFETDRPFSGKLPDGESDAWYLDVPGLNCRSENPRSFSMLAQGMVASLMRQGSFKGVSLVSYFTGPTPDGLLIEETLTKHIDGKTFVNKMDLLEVSQDPQNESLFTVPADYKLEEPSGSRQVTPGPITMPSTTDR